MEKNVRVAACRPYQSDSNLKSKLTALREPNSSNMNRPRSPLVYQDDNLAPAISAPLGKEEASSKNRTRYYAGKGGNGDTTAHVAHDRQVGKDNNTPLFPEGEVWNKYYAWKAAREKENGVAPFIAAIRAFPPGPEFPPGDTLGTWVHGHEISPKDQTIRPVHKTVIVDEPPLSGNSSPKTGDETNNKENPLWPAPTDAEVCDDENLMGAIRTSLGRPKLPTRNNARRRPKLDSVLDGPFDPTRFLQGERYIPARRNPLHRPRRRKQSEDENHISPRGLPMRVNVECSVCTDMFAPCDMAAGRIGSGCDHSSPEIVHQYVCKGCLEQHLGVQLNQSGANRLACPLCLAELTYSDIKNWASQETFARYDTLRMRTTVSSDPNFIWCSNPRCGAGQVHATGAEAPIVICQSCGTKTCFRHQQRWHEGLTCDEFDDPDAVEERQRRDQAEMEAIEREQREEERRIRLQLQNDEVMARRIEAENSRQSEERRKQAELLHLRQQRVAEQRKQREEQEAERQRKKTQEEENRRTKVQRDERARRLAEEKQGEATVFKSTKLCPGPNCSYRVEKIDGCKHMACKSHTLEAALH